MKNIMVYLHIVAIDRLYTAQEVRTQKASLICWMIFALIQLLQSNKYIQKSNELPEDLLFVPWPFL